jgi:hypothetical protein
MNTTDEGSGNTSGMPGTGSVDMKLEVLIIPVSDAYMVAEQAGTELPQ